MDYKSLFDLTGKVCIVTGATGYLGNANARCLKDFGATVVIADVRAEEERFENADQFIGDMYVHCDISSSESIASAFKKVADAYGKIDVLVNCANYGGGYGKESFVEFMPDAAFEKGIDGTICATFRCTREVIPYMKEHGGSIINYCSMYGLVSPDLRLYEGGTSRQPANYGAGKAAIDQFTRYCACDLAPYGIRVNAVTPGPFPNPRNQDGEFNRKLADKTMLGRIGKSCEMSGAVLLLASDASSYMTGTNIVVDGGWTAW